MRRGDVTALTRGGTDRRAGPLGGGAEPQPLGAPGPPWFGAELPAGDQVWFRIAEEAIGRMPEKTPRDRGARLVDALIVWIVPDHDAPGRKAGAILARRLFDPRRTPAPTWAGVPAGGKRVNQPPTAC